MRKKVIQAIVCIFILVSIWEVNSIVKARAKSAAVQEVIGVRTFEYQDEKRNRPVTVELWYPVGADVQASIADEDIYLHPQEARNAPVSLKDKKYPLVLMSHGHHGDRRDRSWLAKMLVQSNFIVASVEHHGNSRHSFDPLITLKYWERARDMTYALDHIMQEEAIRGKIDEENIGFVGYSLGGMTGLALAGCKVEATEDLIEKNKATLAEFPPEVLAQIDFSEATCEQCEPRIKAYLLIAPANFLYQPKALEQIHAPVGLISAINDEILPHLHHSHPIIQHVVPVKLKVLEKEVSHFSFVNQISEVGKKLLPEKYHAESATRDAIHQEVGSFATEFFHEHLEDAHVVLFF